MNRSVAGARRLRLALALALGLLLYGRALPLPFYDDDLIQIPWVDEQSWARLWTQVHFWGAYRPVVFSLWKLVVILQDG